MLRQAPNVRLLDRLGRPVDHELGANGEVSPARTRYVVGVDGQMRGPFPPLASAPRQPFTLARRVGLGKGLVTCYRM
jgi:hypothetical protein